MKNYRDIIMLIGPKQTQNVIIVILMMVIMGLLEVVGLVSIIPFITLISAPEQIISNPKYLIIFETLGLTSDDTTDDFIVRFGLISIGILMVSAAYRSLCHYYIHKCIESCRNQISTDLFNLYLRTKYNVNRKLHSAQVIASITTQTDQFITAVFRPTVLLLAYGVIGCCLFIFLLSYDWLVSICLLAVFGVLYSIIYRFINMSLAKLGKIVTTANHGRIKALSEATMSSKIIKLTNSEKFFLDKFRTASTQFTQAQAKITPLRLIPIELVDFLVFSSIIGSLIIYMMQQTGSHDEAFLNLVTHISVFIIAAYRIKPVYINVYNGFTSMRFGEFLIGDLINLRDDLSVSSVYLEVEPSSDKFYAMSLDNVGFTYENATHSLFSGLQVNIEANDIVGIIGPSGVGKSTLIDIIVGLLDPSEGTISINGDPLSSLERQAWLTRFGYVSQDAVILDDTITNNIAFGVDLDKIDFNRIEYATKATEIYDFIEQLDEKYDTYLGENGSNISGGQKQRLAIARALYFDPTILILDEPTSALDAPTGELIMNNIQKLSKNITIIVITHDKNCAKICDKIIDLRSYKIQNIN
jgi:ATP-binding cassette, subfamily B, bacterial PglK